jgi:hypothetical protein
MKLRKQRERKQEETERKDGEKEWARNQRPIKSGPVWHHRRTTRPPRDGTILQPPSPFTEVLLIHENNVRCFLFMMITWWQNLNCRFTWPYFNEGRSQWPRGLRYEMSSPALTLGSCIRISLKAWISVCVYFVFVLGSGLAMGWSPV